MKLKPISTDPKHPLFGIMAREFDSFMSITDRSAEIRVTIQAVLHEKTCVECGDCCKSNKHNKFKVYEDDRLFKIRLAKDKKELSNDSDGFDRFYFNPIQCDYLSSSGCAAYLDRPMI